MTASATLENYTTLTDVTLGQRHPASSLPFGPNWLPRHKIG